LIRGDENAVYGDKAYASQGLRDRLADAGIADGLMYKAARNKPLKPWQTWFNKAVAAIRAAVERRFGIMKRGYGFRRVRATSGSAAHLQLLNAINLKRAALRDARVRHVEMGNKLHGLV
jgi:IS5 family transposase